MTKCKWSSNDARLITALTIHRKEDATSACAITLKIYGSWDKSCLRSRDFLLRHPKQFNDALAQHGVPVEYPSMQLLQAWRRDHGLWLKECTNYLLSSNRTLSTQDGSHNLLVWLNDEVMLLDCSNSQRADDILQVCHISQEMNEIAFLKDNISYLPPDLGLQSATIDQLKTLEAVHQRAPYGCPGDREILLHHGFDPMNVDRWFKRYSRSLHVIHLVADGPADVTTQNRAPASGATYAVRKPGCVQSSGKL